MNGWERGGGARTTPLFEALRTEAHVWLVDTGDPAVTERLAAFEDLLDEEERARHRRYLRERARSLFLVSHALLRTTLSRYVAVPPAAWAFAAAAHGRPEIARPLTLPPLRFNLSHTPGLAACAVVLARDVGLDVERTRPTGDLLHLARHTLIERELQALLRLPQRERPGRFLTSWTLKEAYSKARGLGLSLPLRSYGFELEGAGDDHPRLLPPPEDDPHDWQFFTARPTAEHHLSLAIRRGGGADLHVRLRSEALSLP